jgi:hypothetical protein
MTEVTAAGGWTAMSPAQTDRWAEVLRRLAEALTPGPSLVVVGHRHAAMFADRLADALGSVGHECGRLSDEHPRPDGDAWLSRRGPRTAGHPPHRLLAGRPGSVVPRGDPGLLRRSGGDLGRQAVGTPSSTRRVGPRSPPATAGNFDPTSH